MRIQSPALRLVCKICPHRIKQKGTEISREFLASTFSNLSSVILFLARERASKDFVSRGEKPSIPTKRLWSFVIILTIN